MFELAHCTEQFPDTEIPPSPPCTSHARTRKVAIAPE
jgi:hypothetical protein